MNNSRALVVDDDDDMLSLVSTALRKMGYDTVECRSTSQAKAAFGLTHSFDVIITDHDMPDASGIELIRFIIALAPEPKPRIILYTGIDLSAPEIKAFRAQLPGGWPIYFERKGGRVPRLVENLDEKKRGSLQDG